VTCRLQALSQAAGARQWEILARMQSPLSTDKEREVLLTGVRRTFEI